MSNVLIGIIGVILFIGLALAGALILGDDFRSASTDSQAAALVQQMQQVSNAVDMWKLKTGQSSFPNQDTAFLVPRFLKTVAVNPTSQGHANAGSYLYAPHFNNDVYMDGTDENGSQTASHLMAVIGPESDTRSRAICQTVADQFTGGTIVTSNPSPLGTGCTDLQGYYAMYIRL